MTIAFVQEARPSRRGLCFAARFGRREIACVASTRFISSPPSLSLLGSFSSSAACILLRSFLPFQKQQSIHCLNVALSLPLPLPTASRTTTEERPLARPSVKCSTTTTTTRRKWSLARSLTGRGKQGNPTTRRASDQEELSPSFGRRPASRGRGRGGPVPDHPLLPSFLPFNVNDFLRSNPTKITPPLQSLFIMARAQGVPSPARASPNSIQ